MRVCLWLRLARTALCGVVALLALPAAVARGQSGDFDDWQGFKPGSWRELLTTIETLDSQGTTVASKGTSVARTRLASVAGDAVVLEVAEGSIDYAGKRFPTPAAKLVLRPFGRQDDEKVAVADAGKVELEIGGQKILAASAKAQLAGGSANREVLTVFRDLPTAHMPLRRVSTVFGADGKPENTTTAEALSLDGSLTVSGRVVATVHYRVLYRNHKITSNALVDKSADVPGQLVRATIAERDASGKLLRVVTQELLDYHVATDAIPGREVGERPRERREERREERRDERRLRRLQ